MAKPGQSFEHAIAYILASAGFVVREQPRLVKLGGEVVGDIDILAVDPKSNTSIAVTCKEWRDQTPQAKDFNHFLSLMEIENVKHGIVAWTNIPSSVYPLSQNAEKRGYRIYILDPESYRLLHNFMLSGQNDRVEDQLRRGLGLAATSVPTVGQEISLRKTNVQKRSVRCSNLLPLHYASDPPRYVRNAYFKPAEAKLLLKPCLLSIFHAYKEARIPGTGELLDEIDEDVFTLCDGVTGKYIRPGDHFYQVVRDYYHEAYSQYTVEEEDFTVELVEPKVNRDAMLYKMRVDAARSLEPLKVKWIDEEGEEHERLIEVSPKDLREVYSNFIWVPIWHVVYRLGYYTYTREFFATDGEILHDDMYVCKKCEEPTVAICARCGSTACSRHIVECEVCGEFFCDEDSLKCVSCLKSYCKAHGKGGSCVICGSFMDSACEVRCIICDKAVCPTHAASCVECGNVVCPNHTIEARYVLVKRQFCSEICRNKYDKEYREKGVLGKLGHIIKK